jgi:hypothetical protein
VDASREDAAVAPVPRTPEPAATFADTDTEADAEAGEAAPGGRPQTLQ